MARIAVAARSFARNAALRAELSARYSEVTFSDSVQLLSGQDLVRFLHGHDSAIIGLERIDDGILSQVPDLKIISKYGVGLDGLDIEAIAQRGIRLGWIGGVNRRSVAELTLSFALALMHRVPETAFALRDNNWQKLVGRQLSGRTIGIIGCGFVGQDLVHLLKPFGCRILAHDIREYPEFYAANHMTPVALHELLRESDIVTLHVPLDASTAGMIGAAEMAMMKPGSGIINAARGGLIHEEALVEALRSGHLAGAACDVYAIEPDANPRLLSMPTFLGTPHIGGSTQESQLAMGRAAIEGLERNRVPGNGWPG